VNAIDISTALLDAARDLSAHTEPPIAFHRADAEHMPFPDGRFDSVISTYGVMFAQDQRKAAAELGRVCRPGGRLVLATWTPDGAVAEFFGILGKHSDSPPPASSPLAWGDPDHIETLLGEMFELSFERGVNNAYHASTAAIWDWYVRGFGPLRQLVETLPPERVAALKRDVDAYHQHYSAPAGLHVKRDYLITIGRRR
jgi:SAM-dependent methyltransferase